MACYGVNVELPRKLACFSEIDKVKHTALKHPSFKSSFCQTVQFRHSSHLTDSFLFLLLFYYYYYYSFYSLLFGRLLLTKMRFQVALLVVLTVDSMAQELNTRVPYAEWLGQSAGEKKSVMVIQGNAAISTGCSMRKLQH